MFALWVWQRLPRGGAMTAIAVLLLYPYALFLYGSMYADSLFLLTAIGALVLLEGGTSGWPDWSARWRQLVARLGSRWRSGWSSACSRCMRGAASSVLMRRSSGRRSRPTRLGPSAPAADPPVGTGGPGWRDLRGPFPAVRWREAGVLLSGIG